MNADWMNNHKLTYQQEITLELTFLFSLVREHILNQPQETTHDPLLLISLSNYFI